MGKHIINAAWWCGLAGTDPAGTELPRRETKNGGIPNSNIFKWLFE
jgi:hypothetical protein